MIRKCLRVLLTLSLLVSSQAFAQTLIVHPEQDDTLLSRTSIRAIFAMRIPQWPDGSPVHVFVFEDNHPLHIQFSKSILGMFPYQLRRIWDRQVFSGTGIEPTRVATEQEMLSRVARTKGAIGYVEPGLINDSVRPLGISP